MHPGTVIESAHSQDFHEWGQTLSVDPGRAEGVRARLERDPLWPRVAAQCTAVVPLQRQGNVTVRCRGDSGQRADFTDVPVRGSVVQI